MDSEDSNFPSATKDRKPSELNYPCLTHTLDETTHTHTQAAVFVDTQTHKHTHIHLCGP